jgi:hypothetical protein
MIAPYSWWGEGSPPGAGDFLRTLTGTCYKIEEAHPIREDACRLRLRCTRLERNAVAYGEEGVYDLEWAPRRRRGAVHQARGRYAAA